MPDLFQRQATDVEAMQLCTRRDLHVADLWLRAHGMGTDRWHPALTDRGLLVPTGARTYVTARLGQWVTHDLATAGFTVADDDLFRLVHRPSLLPARLDTVKEAR